MRNGTRLILILIVIVTGGCAGTAWAREEVERDFRKTVPLTAGRGVHLDNSNGNITVRTHARNEVEIHASMRCSANTAAEAKRFCDQVQIVVDSGSGVSAHTQFPSDWNGRNLSYSVHYDVTIPETAPLEVRNRFGNVSISGLHAAGIIRNNNGAVELLGGRGRQEIENAFGEVKVLTNDGDVVVRGGNGAVTATDIGGTLDITNRFGDIHVSHARKTLSIHANNSSIDVQDVTGAATISDSFGKVSVTDARDNVTVQRQNGEVRATNVSGIADLRTSFGPIVFSHVGKALVVHAQNSQISGDTVGESATVETTFGGVDLKGVKGGARVTAGNSSVRINGIGGEVYAKTSFNGIDISDVGGPVVVESQNGSVTVAPRAGRCQGISLRTNFGPIRVTVPNGAGYNVTAHTSFGRIHSEADMTVSGDIGQDTLAGKIGGGGCDLKLMNQNGSIDIVKGR